MARLGLPRNQGELFGRRQREIPSAIVLPDADKIVSAGINTNSGHRARLLPFVFDVIARNRRFTGRVWHSRASCRALGIGLTRLRRMNATPNVGNDATRASRVPKRRMVDSIVGTIWHQLTLGAVVTPCIIET